MDSLKVIELVKSLKVKNMSLGQVVSTLADRKIVHRLAAISIVAIYEIPLKKAKEKVYENTYYSRFKDELNPFNEEFFQKIKVQGDEKKE